MVCAYPEKRLCWEEQDTASKITALKQATQTAVLIVAGMNGDVPGKPSGKAGMQPRTN